MATMPIESWALRRLWPRAVTMAIARSSAGNTRSTSIPRIRTLSSQPPAKPATIPISVPSTIAKPTVANPTNSDTRAPWTTRLNTSRTFESVPIRSSGWAAGQPRWWMHGGDDFLTPSTTPNRGWSGAYVEIWSANAAVSRRNERIVNPTIAFRWRRMLPSVSRQMPFEVDRAPTSSASTTAVIAMSSCQPNSRVEECVGNVHDQVDEQVDDRDHEHEALDGREVAAPDRLGDGPPDPRQIENRFGQ